MPLQSRRKKTACQFFLKKLGQEPTIFKTTAFSPSLNQERLTTPAPKAGRKFCPKHSDFFLKKN
jgi:hypothetical protein